MYTCPVCGYNKLVLPAEDFYTCPSCGTEFGYHDAAETYEGRERQWERLRLKWIARNTPWFSPVVAPPINWNPGVQLLRVTRTNFRVRDAKFDRRERRIA